MENAKFPYRRITMCRHASSSLSLALLFASATLLRAEPSFTSKPRADSDSSGTHVRFAGSEPTDAEVTILNADGHIVRRLAAGLGGAQQASTHSDATAHTNSCSNRIP